MKRVLIVSIFLICSHYLFGQRLNDYNLSFTSIPNKWDEALPLGNGMLGVLVWQKGDNLRFSLDRADLWDEREAFDISKLNYNWVREQVLAKREDTLQKLGDVPYIKIPYPTKIPAAAFEFNIATFGKVKSASVDIATATAKVVWENGTIMETFVHAKLPFGAFRIIHAPANLVPILKAPAYSLPKEKIASNEIDGQAVANLGYPEGKIEKSSHNVTYTQQGGNGFRYEVSVSWKYIKDTLEGVWSIASYQSGDKDNQVAKKLCAEKLLSSYNQLLPSHLSWWQRYWGQSSVLIPDTLLQKQYYLEMYKLGCVARKGAPPITLQAIWTADNGALPPWKGDIHNDLNTQLSYWPAYTGNHLREASNFTDWLWKVRDENKKFTKEYFQVDGLNVPGVATLLGKPMGGWIQYSLSPTVSAWLAQHFYWQWKYSMDKKFLKKEAYPYLHEVATFLANITKVKDGVRELPLSTAPEYHDNSLQAWYLDGNTNYDVSLMRFVFDAAAELAGAMNKNKEAKHWQTLKQELPSFAVDSTGLMMAPGEDRMESHRHHCNLMAIYPLGQLNPENAADKVIIDNSLRWLEHTGTRAWCGYSFSWAASLYARDKDGEGAANQLHIFASNFCSPNSFHLNGDQKGGQYSGFTYRPFTLEGNFAFAQGVHEMLLQSYSGIIEVFPAIPAEWKTVSFKDLRTEGAFLISAKMEGGKTKEIKINSEKGGVAKIKLPSESYNFDGDRIISKKVKNGILEIAFRQNGSARISF